MSAYSQHSLGWTAGSTEVGLVTSINGSNVTIDIETREFAQDARVTVGSFVGIRAGEAHLVGLVRNLAASPSASGALHTIQAKADLDLLGEILSESWGYQRFRRGVACYPAIGDKVEVLSADNLRLVFQVSASDTVEIGSLYQDASMPASVKVDDLLSKHFAVLGTTGVGKSSGVAVILDQVLQARRDLRVFLLDVHNEYARCFGGQANVVSPRTLKLPFWLFNLEETVAVIYGGRPPVEEEIEILAELIPIAKGKYAQYKEASERQLAKRSVAKGSVYTVDTPVPYVLQDLISLIDERMGRLENRTSRMHYHRLITRIEALRNDPRYAFMIENANVGGDMMGELLAHLFRLEPDGRPMTIMQLAGLPIEVVDAVVCVLCRLAFDFGIWSDGAMPLLFVCEEAHRYASADRSVGFSPTRRALSRIAREGRKHGVHLGLVTQRPAELDPTIISQCSTLFAMRMSNERDQAFLAAAVADGTNLQSFVPLLGTGEVIAFGEGVPLPARMKFRELPQDRMPQAESLGHSQGMDGLSNAAFIGAVVERWRGATMNAKSPAENESGFGGQAGPGHAQAAAQAHPTPPYQQPAGARMPPAEAAIGSAREPAAPHASRDAARSPGFGQVAGQARPIRDYAEETSSASALEQAHRRLLRRSLHPDAAAAGQEPRTEPNLWQLR